MTDVERFGDWNPTTEAGHKITPGPIGEGTSFEVSIKGFGKQVLTLADYRVDEQVRLVPTSRMFAGGHLFEFSDDGGRTRVDHELVMEPKHVFKLLSPMMGRMARKNLAATADALQSHLERNAAKAP